MSLIVKFLYGPETPGENDRTPSTLFGDVTSVTFDNEGVFARLWVREPIKTALVPGFCENERLVQIGGPVYVMNEAGKTISVFRPGPQGAAPEVEPTQ